MHHVESSHSVPAILTDLALNKYVEHLAAVRSLTGSSTAGTSSDLGCLESKLAPLYLIHGKVFTSAVGIALHGAEPITRYVAHEIHAEGDGDQQQEQEDNWNSNGCFSGRCLYFVGEHSLLSQYYCSCRAYNYFGIQRQESSMCKHLLALRIALLLERQGLAKDCIRVQRVDACRLQEMMRQVHLDEIS